MAPESKNAQNAKFCPECGNKLPQNVRFCSNCGTKINLFTETQENIFSEIECLNNQHEKGKMHPLNKALLITVIICFSCFFFAALSSFFLRFGILARLFVITTYASIPTIIILIILPRKYQSDGNEHGGLNILSFLFPLVGFIFYFVWHEEKQNKAKGIIRNAIISSILNVILLIILIAVSSSS